MSVIFLYPQDDLIESKLEKLSSNGTLHWFLSAPYAWDEIWWLPIADGVVSEDGFQSELFFEKIDDKLFLTVVNSPGDEPQVSEFLFNPEEMTLTIVEDIFPEWTMLIKTLSRLKYLTRMNQYYFKMVQELQKTQGGPGDLKEKDINI